jgi:hypothetical protein
MAVMAMVHAQNAKNMGGKFPKKVKLSTFFFFQKTLSPRKMTLKGSTWAQNISRAQNAMTVY